MNCGICGKDFEFKCRYEAHKKQCNCKPNPNFIIDNIDNINIDDLKKSLLFYCNNNIEKINNCSKNEGKINCEFCNKLILKKNMKRHLETCKSYIEKPIIKSYSKPNNIIINESCKNKIRIYFKKLKIISSNISCKILFDIYKIIFSEYENKNWKIETNKKEIKFYYNNRVEYFSLDKYITKQMRLNLNNKLKNIFTYDEMDNLEEGRLYNNYDEKKNKNCISYFYDFINSNSVYNNYLNVKENYKEFIYLLQSINEENKKFIKLNFN